MNVEMNQQNGLEDVSVLGINPPYRNSGDLTNAEEIII